MLLYRGTALNNGNKSTHSPNDVFTVNKFSFSEHTTYGCGGFAEEAYFPTDAAKTAFIYDKLTSDNKKIYIIGNGSNILAADGVIHGAVISTKRLIGIKKTAQDGVFCRSGTTVTALLHFCVAHGLSGLEFLAGIPATVGGLVLMNGGAGGKFIGGRVSAVKFYDGKLRTFSNNDCNFDYKYSIMRDINGIITGCCLNLDRSDSETVKDNIDFFLKKRSIQPKGKSCGCVFKNPDGLSAGKLIEDAGLKGLKLGCAQISAQHANFIINTGDKSSDVYALIAEVKSRVFKRAKIRLEEEVVYIGDFNGADS